MSDNRFLALGGNQETIDRYSYTGVPNVLSADGVFSILLSFWVEKRFRDSVACAPWSA